MATWQIRPRSGRSTSACSSPMRSSAGGWVQSTDSKHRHLLFPRTRGAGSRSMSSYSVIVVARNHSRALLGTLLALRKCARPGEVVLVDNASDADLSNVAALSQLPIRCQHLSEHQSLGAAFNAGLD